MQRTLRYLTKATKKLDHATQKQVDEKFDAYLADMKSYYKILEVKEFPTYTEVTYDDK